jgi:tetratricopeptide (TPR) repeat protein
MTELSRALTVLGLHAAAVATLGAALSFGAGAEPTSPPAAPAKPEPAKIRLEDISEIVFYIAKGDANACGHGCDQWIAADGKIDGGAPQRLRTLLAKIGKRRLPIFFHSPGGIVGGGLELGRLIRQQKLVTGVARTIPGGCDRDNLRDKTCEALKRSGMEVKSDFDTDVTLCNSSCVWALLGGTEHLVPPWVKIGIHDVGRDPTKTASRGASLVEARRAAHVRILEYAREVGIDRALPEAAFAVPNESARYLDRNELVRFGIDRREFGETAWHFAEKPAAAIYKKFFIRTDNGDQPRYRNGYVRLDYCGARVQIGLAFAQERDLSEKSADLLLDLNGQRIILPYLAQTSQFLVNSTSLSREAFDMLGHGPSIKVSGFDRGEKDGSVRSVTLSMDGFSEASVKLRKSCADAAQTAIASGRQWSVGKSADPKYNNNPNCQPGGDTLRCMQGDRRVGTITPPRTSITVAQPTNPTGPARGPWGIVPSAPGKIATEADEAVRLDPKDAKAYVGRGTAWYAKGEYDRAIADYNEAARLDPKDAKAYIGRGAAWYAKGEYDRAIVDYNEPVRIDPKAVFAHIIGRGNARYAKGEYDRAIADYTEAVWLDPKHAQAYVNRGAALDAKAEYDRAIADYSEAIRLDPKYVEAYLGPRHRLARERRLRPRHSRLQRGPPARSERCQALHWPRHCEPLFRLAARGAGRPQPGNGTRSEERPICALARCCQQAKPCRKPIAAGCRANRYDKVAGAGDPAVPWPVDAGRPSGRRR